MTGAGGRELISTMFKLHLSMMHDFPPVPGEGLSPDMAFLTSCISEVDVSRLALYHNQQLPTGPVLMILSMVAFLG
jgi:hypothetical protein